MTGPTLAVVLALVLGAASALGQDGAAGPTTKPHVEPLAPIPDRGSVPPTRGLPDTAPEEELDFRARARGYEHQLRLLRRKHFGPIRVESTRAQGLDALHEFVDPASFRPMIEVLDGERDDVRLAMLDHFADAAAEGQAALAWMAITSEDAAIRHEAIARMVSPPPPPVLRVLDQALRSRKHEVANRAGALAGTLGALETIPLLIFGQATRDPRPSDEGDLAWIAIETQVAYVANVQPVVGDNSGAFLPIVGVVSEGVVLRATDAVVVVYRTAVHEALVSMTSRDWGQPTDHLGYDMKAWWAWYNSEYVPCKNEQRRLAALAQPPAETGGEEQP